MERISIKNFDVASMNKLQNEKFVNCFHHQVVFIEPNSRDRRAESSSLYRPAKGEPFGKLYNYVDEATVLDVFTIYQVSLMTKCWQNQCMNSY